MHQNATHRCAPLALHSCPLSGGNLDVAPAGPIPICGVAIEEVRLRGVVVVAARAVQQSLWQHAVSSRVCNQADRIRKPQGLSDPKVIGLLSHIHSHTFVGGTAAFHDPAALNLLAQVFWRLVSLSRGPRAICHLCTSAPFAIATLCTQCLPSASADLQAIALVELQASAGAILGGVPDSFRHCLIPTGHRSAAHVEKHTKELGFGHARHLSRRHDEPHLSLRFVPTPHP